VDVQWLDFLLLIVAAGDFIFASLNCLYFAGYAREAPSPARRLGAGALVLVNAGLSLEALLFLSQAPATVASLPRTLATVLVRGVLFLASGSIGVLVWRNRSSR
jgi:hypothetical protein